MHRLTQTPKRKSIALALLPLSLGLLMSCSSTEAPSDTESPASTPAESSASDASTDSLDRSVADPSATTDETADNSNSGTETLASSASSGKVDLAAIIGTEDDGWLPKTLSEYDFKRGMSPEEVGKILPGAEKISKFGFSEVPAKGVPGVDKYKFSFLKDKKDPEGKRTLYSVSLLFDPSIKKDHPYDKVALAFAEKYGEVEPEKIEKKIVTWVGPNFATAQFTNSINKFEGYEFKIVVPKS
ncbi:hypothetical protein [Acaryochloris sp. CCMEE 5410]|uniref:hypothetical protein n=1 Tax=Acaryochloris sp. CCMEE 5410 TaxID=310037 RepID=UPI0002483DFD|nr:hypothetical protein [Acaryochloris sp. CCMEE 5410]KAI9133639.1 hypothetical protein ON05_010225 [Acaryochloris sp. CCMEE 5410]